MLTHLTQPFRSPAFALPRKSRVFLLALFGALLVHIVSFLALHVLRRLFPVSAAESRVSVQTIDPQKLRAVQDQWKKQGILLNPQGKIQDSPPPDARFLSDRNVRVEKETRARNSAIVPRPQSRSLPPPLAQLGVPLLQGRTARHRQTSVAPTLEQGASEQSVAGQENLPVGSQTLLNAQESVFYSFYARIYSAIGPIWSSAVRVVPQNRRLIPGSYVTVVEIEINAEGILQGVRVLKSAGVSELDQVVDRSWRKIGKFPNPPRGLLQGDTSARMVWSFEFQLSEGLGWRAGSSQRLE